MGLDPQINPGYDEVHYTVSIVADGTDDQIEQLHQAVMRTSPNFSNFSKSIRMVPKLVIAQQEAVR